MGIAIKVENVSKQYRLGKVGTGTFAHDLNRWWHLVRGKEDPYLKIGEVNDRTTKGDIDYVWALRDINFEIEQGAAVGIIGRNGAGKSTLLKILSRTTAPTTGSVKMKGRVASLLEVGTGFHPELSGRENIYLNGAILGMTRREITKKFDEIVDFSGVERYIDTPVKRYSSGMYVRLAFAVAAHLESETLIVDEVLAVGDAEFQKKCLGKMGEVSKGEGRTVLFVSHNMVAVKKICNKSILLESGLLTSTDDTDIVINNYIKSSQYNSYHLNKIQLSQRKRTEGKNPCIVEAWIENKKGEIIQEIIMGEDFLIKFYFKSNENIQNALFGFGIENVYGMRITSLNNEISGDEVLKNVREGVAVIDINKPNIVSGTYYISLSIVSNQNEWIDYIEQALQFTIMPNDIYQSGKLLHQSHGYSFLNASIKLIAHE